MEKASDCSDSVRLEVRIEHPRIKCILRTQTLMKSSQGFDENQRK
jgi:hypothetical protein